MTNVWPNGELTRPTVTANFGPYDPFKTGRPTRHNGIDLVGFDSIHSPVTGVVTFAGYNGAAGNEVRIREDGTGDVIRLLHNRALVVRTGQRVSQWQVVAYMGSTGQSTGKHCHEETRPGGGAPIDPNVWYSQRNNNTAGGNGTPLPIDEEFPVNVVLYLYIPTNSLILVDHLNKTMRNLGNSAMDVNRDYFSRKPYIRAIDKPNTRKAGEVYWQDVVGVTKDAPNGIYKYI